MSRAADVIVIGGGIAGLRAACDLTTAGFSVALLEARDRLGGRIHTRRYAGYPVELGAEFIHGRPEEILRVVAETGLHIVPAEGGFISKREGRWLHSDEIWSEINRVFESIPSDAPDQTFLNYVDGVQASPEAKERVLGFVEGYHAANPGRVSLHWLTRTMKADAQAGGERSFRLVDGYDGLIEALAGRLDPSRCEIHLQTHVTEVRWERGHVRIEAGAKQFSAARAVITVPLSMLKLGDLRFLPGLPEKAAVMTLLETGPAVRVCLCFREKFWQTREELRHASFLLTDDPDVPTWWTSRPLPYPILTGWAAGRHAIALASHSEDWIVERALQALGRILETWPEDLRHHLETAFVHDWPSDPFARGAYSYALAGGANSAQALAAPVEETLFFAGEATDFEGRNGTVHGAIASGSRAAREVANKAISK